MWFGVTPTGIRGVRRMPHGLISLLRTRLSSRTIVGKTGANGYSTISRSQPEINSANSFHNEDRRIMPEENSPEDKSNVIAWIRSIRRHKTRVFFDVSDGTSPLDLQVVAPHSLATSNCRVGSAVSVTGDLVQPRSPDHKHVQAELHAHSVHVLDDVAISSDSNPVENVHGLRTPRPDLGLLRSAVGLSWRHRLPELAAMLRLRAQMKQITREVMQQMEYLEVDTPILTTVDCEGTNQTFVVQSSHNQSLNSTVNPTVPLVRLTGSAQLHLEALCLGMSKVYSFNPAFRAESSHTRHHLAEFHMLEAESVHLDTVDRLCTEIEAMTRLLLTRFLEQVGGESTVPSDDCDKSEPSISSAQRDLALVCTSLGSDERWSRQSDVTDPDKQHLFREHLSSLESALAKSFVRVTFQEACDHLKRPTDVSCDLTKDEERRILSWCGNQSPVLVTHFPCALKPFYCHSVDGIHAEAVDLLVPGIGELVGGSVRETCAATLRNRLVTSGVDPANLAWYVDLRGLGGAPHGGFGLGFERLLQFVAGVYNIRDVIPFPRVADKISL